MSELSFEGDCELDDIIDELCELDGSMTEWECRFIFGIRYKRKEYTGGYELSKKQKEIIESIWDKYK